MEVLSYVPSNVVLLISGLQIQGWNNIRISRNAPAFRQIRGIRGKNTRTRIKDSSATLTIETPQTSLVNEVLSKCLEADLETGAVRLEITLKETTGTSFFSTTTAYITAYPELSYSNSIGSNTWTLSCDESQVFIGCARSAAVGIVENGISRLKSFVG
jgi:hypothetical protein